MDGTAIKDGIDKLIQMESDFIEKLKEFKDSVNPDLPGGMKGLILKKFGEIETNANHLVSMLTESKDAMTSDKKVSKKKTNPKIASDVWALLK